MSQIMRLRRRAGDDYHINDRNNGNRHERAFVTLVRDYGLLHEAELLPRSYGGDSWFGKFHPAAAGELLSSLPAVVGGLVRRKISPRLAMFGHKIPKQDLAAVKDIYKDVDGHEPRVELNLYVTGYEDELPPNAPHDDEPDDHDSEQGAGGREPPGEPSVPESESAQSENEEAQR